MYSNCIFWFGSALTSNFGYVHDAVTDMALVYASAGRAPCSMRPSCLPLNVRTMSFAKTGASVGAPSPARGAGQTLLLSRK